MKSLDPETQHNTALLFNRNILFVSLSPIKFPELDCVSEPITKPSVHLMTVIHVENTVVKHVNNNGNKLKFIKILLIRFAR